MHTCLTLDEVEALARDASDEPARSSECARCRQRVERARADRRLLDEVRGAVRPDVGAAAPGVPGYSIERELRRGGQGIVYVALHAATRRRVALKVLLGGRGASATDRRRFEREIELASRLDHPSIVAVYDSGVAGGVPWYAMQLVEGRTLDEWARETRAAPRERVAVFARICSAVAHAQRRGVIHRDLKPANIVVDAAAQPHVLDFGTALAADALEPRDARARLRMTAPGDFLGTLAYAAPEQLDGGDAIDTRTDVFALGLVLYELLTGTLPSSRTKSLADIVASHGEPAPRAARTARGIDADLDAIVAKALAHDAPARYDSARALEQDLERHLRGAAVEARGRGALYVLRKALARNKGRVAALFAGSAVAVALGIAWLREHDRAERQREQAEIVRAVFQDILGAADPQRMGGDVRLLEVYELVARDVDEALRATPDVQASVEMTIGDTYRRLLRAPQAEQHLRKALERLRAVDGGPRRELARCANLLALALADQNRPEAIAVAEEALAIRERTLAPGDALVSESSRTLAIAVLQQFRDVDDSRARSLLDRALSGFRAVYGDDHPETAETKVWRAQFDRDGEEAGTLLSEAVSTLERHVPRDARTIAAHNAYASFLQARARFDEARRELEASLVTTRALFGDVLTTDVLRRRAHLELVRGDMDTADILSRQAVAHELERWARSKPDAAMRLRALGARMDVQGTTDADVPYAEAFAELRRMEGDGSFELAQWMNGIVMMLRARARPGRSEPLLRQALEIHCRALGGDCPVRQRSIELLAEELHSEARGIEAVPLLVESLATYARRGESASEDARRVQRLLAACRGDAPPR